MGALMAVAPWCTHIMFYGSSLTFMLVYLWGKRNPGMQISLLGLLAFNAPYLAWVLLGFSLLLGHDVSSDLRTQNRALKLCALAQKDDGVGPKNQL